MKKYYFVPIVFLLLSGCLIPYYKYSGSYKVELQEVERPKNSMQRYGEPKISSLNDNGVTRFGYNDSLIAIVWSINQNDFGFVLENNSEYSIKILWDEAAYVDVNGVSGKVIHSGIKFIDKNNPQPPTVVPKKARINESIVPSDKIRYISGQYGGWVQMPILPNSATTAEGMDSVSKKHLGKNVKILLPIEAKDVVNEYIFTFKVESFTLKK